MYNDRPPSVSEADADVPVKPKVFNINLVILHYLIYHQSQRRLRLEQGWCWKGLLYVLAVYAVVSIAVAVPYFVTHVS